MGKLEKNSAGGISPVTTFARHCLAVRVRLIDRVITSTYNRALRPLDLNATQMNVLAVVALLGRAGPEQVCRMLQMSKSTLSRNIALLRRNGWVEVVPGEDARTRWLALSPRGRLLLRRAEAAWKRAQHETAALLGDDGVAAINRIAETLWARAGSGAAEQVLHLKKGDYDATR